MKKVAIWVVAYALAVGSAIADEHKFMTEGELKKIDLAGQRVTLRHGPIENLKMPGMTMVFRIQDVADLEVLAAGDKVRFHADNEDGNFVVTELEKAD